MGEGEKGIMKKIGWVSLGVSLAAVGMVVARELQGRYKFNQRTPIDFYSHAGDAYEFDGTESGVGV